MIYLTIGVAVVLLLVVAIVAARLLIRRNLRFRILHALNMDGLTTDWEDIKTGIHPRLRDYAMHHVLLKLHKDEYIRRLDEGDTYRHKVHKRRAFST